jgi:hypothetical protein
VKDVFAGAELQAERLVEDQPRDAKTDIEDAEDDGGPGGPL